VEEGGSIDEGIADADAIYMTRIQDEWDAKPADGSHARADEAFTFRLRHLDAMRAHACLLHPLPKRDEIEEGRGLRRRSAGHVLAAGAERDVDARRDPGEALRVHQEILRG
jgi:aspartate carbamoyltransferase catalytic subunit